MTETTRRALEQPSRARDFKGKRAPTNPYGGKGISEAEWASVDLRDFPRGLELIGSGLRAIWVDKEILLYQTLSVSLCVLSLYLFMFALFPSFDQWTVQFVMSESTFVFQMFLYYLIAFFITTFFNAATVAVATIRMRGGEPVFMDGVRAASSKLGPISMWALISAFVGMFLALIRRRLGAGTMLAGFTGFTWSVATYFVVPVLLYENEGPIASIRRSMALVARTWKLAIAGNFGMTVIFISFGLLGIVILLPIGILLGGPLTIVVSTVFFLSCVAIVASAINSVLVAALYSFARTGEAPEKVVEYEPLSSRLATIAPELNPLPAIVDVTKPQVNDRYGRMIRRL